MKTEEPTWGERLVASPRFRVGLIVASISLGISFPLYHLLGASGNVLSWGVRSPWGPETALDFDSSVLTLRFGEATHVDQGVSLLLQNTATRSLDVSSYRSLRILGRCSPAPCTLELRLQAASRGPGVAEDQASSGQWAGLGAEATDVWLPLEKFSHPVERPEITGVILARTEPIRERDKAPKARTISITALEFR